MIRRIRRRLRDGDRPVGRAFARQLARLYHKRAGLRPYNTDGFDVFGADWDNLLVLDACRHDAFADAIPDDLDGTLGSRVSRGSMTREWVRGNFAGRRLHDTVYVTANGNFAKMRDAIDAEVHAEVSLWRDDHRSGPGDSVARPAAVAEATRDATEEYPRKRILAHFVQPHTPYLGETGSRFDPRVPLGDIPDEYDVSDDVIERAYRENLDLALEEVIRLLPDLPGKTVVTADHGELLGDPLRPVPVRDYGHPDGVYVDELVRVPWFVSENGERKTVESDPPVDDEEVDPAAVEEHLADLGYVT